MKKLLLTIMLSIMPILCFSQKKKLASNNVKEYREYLAKSEGLGKALYDVISKCKMGSIFDKSAIDEEPSVDYNKKMDAYEYVYKLDECNIIFYVKNGKIIEKIMVVFNLTYYQELVNYLDLRNKEFTIEKGFKINDDEYLIISKSRKNDYDSYSFDFTGLEYHNLLDYLKSKEK